MASYIGWSDERLANVLRRAEGDVELAQQTVDRAERALDEAVLATVPPVARDRKSQA